MRSASGPLPGRLTTLASLFLGLAAIRGQPPPNTHPLRMGGDQSGGNRYRGAMAAVRLYSRALTADDLARLAAAHPNARSSVSNLVSEWVLGGTNGVFASQPELPPSATGTVQVATEPLRRPTFALSRPGRTRDPATA